MLFEIALADVTAPRLVPELTAPFSQAKDQAQDSKSVTDTWASRNKTVAIQGGAPGGPTGIAGASFEYAPLPWTIIGAGGGFNGHGVTGAIWPRFRLPLNRHFAVGFGVPFSAGPYEALAPDLTLELADGAAVSILNSDTLVRSLDEPYGNHRPEGIFFASGPSIRSVRARPSGPSTRRRSASRSVIPVACSTSSLRTM